MSRKGRLYRRQQYLVDALERLMFPHQESEEEQEAFTDVGRDRVAQWIEDVVFPFVRGQLQNPPLGIVVDKGGEHFVAERSDVREVRILDQMFRVATYSIGKRSLPYARGRVAAEQDATLLL